MSAPPLLLDLLRCGGVSGDESRVTEVWRQAAARFSDVSLHRSGSAVAKVKGAGGPLLALFGHIDEIGLLVTHVDSDGLLHFEPIGMWDATILAGQRLVLSTDAGDLPAVVGRSPAHLLTEAQRGQAVRLAELRIDVGACCEAEARDLVEVGDVARLAGDPLELYGGRLTGRALDNRVGTFVVLEALRRHAERPSAVAEVVAVASTQEETTQAGARAVAASLRPDYAVIVDVTFETSDGRIDEGQLGRHGFGSGPVIFRSPSLDDGLVARLREVGQELDLPFTVRAATQTATDADAVQLVGEGVPCAVVCVPIRYMHSAIEVVDLRDVETTVQLLAGLAERLA